MEDSFFGFDTAVPLDDDGGGGSIAEPPEEEYDALNDETFGSAINGDWEEAHESMVRQRSDYNGARSRGGGGVNDLMDISGGASGGSNYSAKQLLQAARLRRADLMADSDLELNLSGMKLDDVDLSFDDSESLGGGISMAGINMDPSVWSSKPPPGAMHQNSRGGGGDSSLFGNEDHGGAGNGLPVNPADFLREHFPSPFQQRMKSEMTARRLSAFGLPQLPNTPKICTLEDIERNLITQQTMQKQQHQQQQQHLQQQQQQQQQLQQSRQHQDQQQQLQQQQQQQQLLNDILKQPSKTPTPVQQQESLHKQQQQQQQQLQPTPTQKGAPPPGFGPVPPAPRPANNFANNLAQHPLGNLLQQQQPNAPGNRLPPPLGFPLFSPHGLGPPHLQQQQQQPQQGGVSHPQLPPHPLLNQHGLPPNFLHHPGHQHHPHHQRPLPNPHLPIALNNFAMHPNFNAMRAAAAAAGIHPAAGLVPAAQQQQLPPSRLPPQHPAALQLHNQQQPPNSMFNMFNMRLVQEIQQNHPLLQNAARQQQQQQLQNMIGPNGQLLHLQLQQQHQQQQLRGGPRQQQQQHQLQQLQQHNRGTGNGNLPHDEFDEYANLMSTRDKHWLIGIQLSQLNTETPFIDDFYFTVYRERKALLSGSARHSQAHKDNQLNHPLTQPKGHAQLILVQLGNKNGTRNGQHRERHNSENNTGGGGAINSGGQDQREQHHHHHHNNHHQQQQQKTPYVFTPLKFENSLGKLQYGSVTAPRKIIDAEIMGAGESPATPEGGHVGSGSLNTTTPTTSKVAAAASLSTASSTPGGDVTSSAQRKSRHILLHIETLYRNVLKLEDLDNPHAIATIIMKKKKESERIAALEQLENANKTPEERAAEANNPQGSSSSMNPALKNKFAYEIETKEALVAKLVAGLTHDKIIAIMNVRKGKALIRRIMPYIENHDIRWNVWIGVFFSLQNVVKKDREDTEGILYALYPDFKKQIKEADFETIVRIAATIPLNDKKSNGVFCSKFGISSLVCLILQSEQIYVASSDVTLNDALKENWRQFLDLVATSLNRTIQNQTICAAIESDSIQPMMNHFARFKDLKLDSLLALVTEAKQQIN